MKTKESHVVIQPDQKGLEFYASKRQAKKVFDAIIKRLSEKGPPYNTAHVPQAVLPSNMVHGSKEHAIFLFILCLWMRGGVESATATSFLKNMYEQRPDVFIPETYWNWGPDLTRKQVDRISEVLTEHRLGQRVEENALGWVYNMRKLAQFWEGDPRKLMTDRPRFNVLARRIIGKTSGKQGQFINEDNPNGFMFFREKMTAMIAYFLMDAGLVPMFYAPVPVDFHVLRLLVSNQVIRVRGKDVKETVGVDFMRNVTQRLAREMTEWYCREYQVSPVALCDALWLLSGTLCRANPGNSGYVTDDQRRLALKESRVVVNSHPMLDIDMESNGAAVEADPIQDGLTGPSSDITGRKRYRGLKRDADTLRKPTLVRSFEKSCGVCPLQDTCRYNISSGAYYTAGMLLPERLRVIPPALQADFLESPGFKGSFHAPVDPTVRFAKITLR
jgi:hypothetical protein